MHQNHLLLAYQLDSPLLYHPLHTLQLNAEKWYVSHLNIINNILINVRI